MDHGDKIVILRHDLDYNYAIQRAYELSRILYAKRITGSFFVRLHSKEYNAFEPRNYYYISEIIKMGHEVGLHFEGHLADVFNIPKKEFILREIATLNALFNLKIETVSQHGPLNAEVGFEEYKHFFDDLDLKELGLKRHTYQQRYLNEFKYISDSNGTWREGCPCELVGKYQKMHILFHPEYYYNKAYDLW